MNDSVVNLIGEKSPQQAYKGYEIRWPVAVKIPPPLFQGWYSSSISDEVKALLRMIMVKPSLGF
jgi:hypothetical protein